MINATTQDKLQHLDYMTLLVFLRLYEFKSGKLTAEAFNVPQSKISRCLSRLRDAFDDPLFVKKVAGLEISDKAQRLYPIIKKIEINHLDLAQEIDKSNDKLDNKVVIHAPSGFTNGLLRNLYQCSCMSACVKSAVLQDNGPNDEEMLLNSQCDVVISCQASSHVGIQNQKICEVRDTFIVARDEHPIWNEIYKPILDRVLNYPVILTEVLHFNSDIEATPLKQFADSRKRELDVAAKTNNLNEISDFLVGTDAITLVVSQGAVDHLTQNEAIRAQMIPKTERAELMRNKPNMNLYMQTRKSERKLTDCVKHKIAQLVTQGANGSDEACLFEK
ncbi:LysR family transcriptional regulator [Shewanella sp. 3_MG-2023]|uniref:LysR family transcriptional regulator n=1 Tax=Shewanella sp. 3_MG-2023 TaxID=3062635 RepID=UPI0026E13424|nr:LysR family transcriptional regulator [Shewanella sp. 3_MG-2023]MDO6777133.1 LysR family transcriptional regulator [Shewanella sp. 3_MG-2023]